MKRKLTVILLLIAMLISLMPMAVSAATGSGAAGGSFTAGAVDTGVKLSWSPFDGAAGYRLYRYEVEEGAWVAGLITATSYVDVDVNANTEYTYQLIPVMSESESVEPSGQFGELTVKTAAQILGGGAAELQADGISKKAMLMKVDDPYMSVNGVMQEIDPGRGTAPLILNSRTLVPIRAIIEAMDGTVGWDDATQKITLGANGHNVEMWLDKTELIVDGASKTMDVAPTAINDRTMVPVRFAAENVGCAVGWIEASSEIVIVYYEGGTPTVVTPGPTVTPDPGPAPDPGPDPVVTPPVTTTGSGPELKSNYTSAELSAIVSDAEALVQNEPTGGRVITSNELYSMLDAYHTSYGSGNSFYTKSLYGQFEYSGGKWSASSCHLSESWSKEIGSKTESLLLKDSYVPEDAGIIECTLSNEDANYYYYYNWIKGETMGSMWKMEKTTSTSPPSLAGPDPVITLYADAVVGGQECIVYSYAMDSYKSYYWFSKSKGFDILRQSFMDGSNSVSVDIVYEESTVDRNDSFFDETNQGVTVWDEWDF